MRTRSGLVLAVAAAFSFGVGGPFGKALLATGWSSGAIVLARCLGVLAVLAIPALLQLRGRWSVLRRNAWVIAAYGGFAVAGAQLCYYSAIRFMPVGAAMLIEYLAPVLLVIATWAWTRRRPGALVLTGSALAIAGLLLVVDLRGGDRTEAIGPVLAGLAAVGVAVYYVVSARVDRELPTSVLLAGSMLVASVVLVLLGLVGVSPIAVSGADTRLLAWTVPWSVPLAVVVGVSTLAAYLFGIAGSTRLGARVASFVGLLEVLFAVLAAWVLLGDLPAPVQLAGGVLILAGVVLVKAQRGEAPAAGGAAHAVRRRRARSRPVLSSRSVDAREAVRPRP